MKRRSREWQAWHGVYVYDVECGVTYARHAWRTGRNRTTMESKSPVVSQPRGPHRIHILFRHPRARVLQSICGFNFSFFGRALPVIAGRTSPTTTPFGRALPVIDALTSSMTTVWLGRALLVLLFITGRTSTMMTDRPGPLIQSHM